MQTHLDTLVASATSHALLEKRYVNEMRLSALSILAVGSVACGVATTSSERDTVSGSDNLSSARAACSEATRPQILAEMAKSPLKPPRSIAGLDLAGGDDWPIVSQTDVEASLCAGTPIANEDPDATEDQFAWGGTTEQPAFIAGFDKTTHKLAIWQLGSTYTGKIEFKSRAGSRFGDHSYSIQVNAPIQRDGQPFVIDYANEAARDEAATELHDGVIATFAPELPPEQTNCRTSARCLLLKLESGEALFGVRDVRFYLGMPAAGITAGATTPGFFYGFPERPAVHPPPRSVDSSRFPR
jgi:hypothetical protein